MSEIRFAPFFFIILLSLISCHPDIDPASLKQTAKDEEKVDNYPSDDELFIPKREIVLYQTKTQGELPEDQKVLIRETLKESFEDFGNFILVPQTRIDKLLQSEKFKNLNPRNVADFIQFGQELNVDFVGQYEVRFVDKTNLRGIVFYRYEIQISVLKTDTKQSLISKKFTFDTSRLNVSKDEIKEIVQIYFPLKGFVIESRNGSEYVKITMGKSLGIEADRKVSFYQRLTQSKIQEVKGKSKSNLQSTTSYSDQIGEGEIIRVLENTSWVKLDEEIRGRIKLGHVAFTNPE